MKFTEYTDNQRRIFIDSEQIHTTYIQAFRQSQNYAGGMHWKKVKGREYLFKTIDRFGNGKSLGLRSVETERIFEQFQKKKKDSTSRLKTLKAKLNEQSRFCKAAKIQRVPRVVSKILRLLEKNRLLGNNVQIVGTNALYAYEAHSGVFLERAMTATMDMDVFWDIRPKLSLVFERDTNHSGFIGILKKADRSFEPIVPGGYRAVNQDGYMIDLIKPEPKPPFKKELNQMGKQHDLMAAEIKNLQWLLSSPKFTQMVIGEDGLPAPMVTPDPRAFALHKLWLSKQDDREPMKKKRDYQQALTTFQLVTQFIPHLRFKKDELRMFPPQIVDTALKYFEDEEQEVQ